MQVIARAFRALERPVVFLAPLVFSHDKNFDRFLFLDAVPLALQQPVVPAQHRCFIVGRQFLTKIDRSDFSAASCVPANRDLESLSFPRRSRSGFRLQPHVIAQRSAQKDVVPRAHSEHRHLDIRVVVFNRNRFPVMVVVRMFQPIREVRREAG